MIQHLNINYKRLLVLIYYFSQEQTKRTLNFTGIWNFPTLSSAKINYLYSLKNYDRRIKIVNKALISSDPRRLNIWLLKYWKLRP